LRTIHSWKNDKTRLIEVPKPMTCEEKARLLEEYDDATLAFSDAV
jgi:hypothetical protein